MTLNKGKAATPRKKIVQANWRGGQPPLFTNDLQQLGQGNYSIELERALAAVASRDQRPLLPTFQPSGVLLEIR
jgi:hypothetical protein